MAARRMRRSCDGSALARCPNRRSRLFAITEVTVLCLTSSLVISWQYHVIIFFYKFCWSLFFPRAVSTLTFCASFAPPVGKCNNVKDGTTSKLLATEQPWPQYISLQNLGQRVYHKKTQDVNNLRRHLFDA